MLLIWSSRVLLCMAWLFLPVGWWVGVVRRTTPCVLHVDLFSWSLWPELSVFVEIDHDLTLDVYEHVGLPVSRHIPKTQGDGCEFLPVAQECQHDIHPRPGRVSCWQLDDLHPAVEIQRDEMAWTLWRVVVMTDDRIDLEGARIPVSHLIPLRMHQAES